MGDYAIKREDKGVPILPDNNLPSNERLQRVCQIRN